MRAKRDRLAFTKIGSASEMVRPLSSAIKYLTVCSSPLYGSGDHGPVAGDLGARMQFHAPPVRFPAPPSPSCEPCQGAAPSRPCRVATSASESTSPLRSVSVQWCEQSECQMAFSLRPSGGPPNPDSSNSAKNRPGEPRTTTDSPSFLSSGNGLSTSRPQLSCSFNELPIRDTSAGMKVAAPSPKEPHFAFTLLALRSKMAIRICRVGAGTKPVFQIA